MEENLLLNYVEEQYNLRIDEWNKIKGVYKILSDGKEYSLKIIKYNYKHFNFILSAMLHLKKSGFKFVPDFIMTKDKKYFFQFEDKYCYLSKWIKSRNCDFNDEKELIKVAENIGVLHKFSEGFKITSDMQPRMYWFNWLKNFYIRKNEIINFKDRIIQKANKDKFDLIYFSEINKEIELAEKAISGLFKSKYIEIMKKQVYKTGFCHHDLAEHNILISEDDKTYFIDFDYCILDSYLHDVASLVVRCGKDGNWSTGKFEKIIKAYSYIQKITDDEIKVLLEFISFPQDFWQLGIQKYWEQKDYHEEVYLKRLSKYLDDRDKKVRFILDINKIRS